MANTKIFCKDCKRRILIFPKILGIQTGVSDEYIEYQEGYVCKDCFEKRRRS